MAAKNTSIVCHNLNFSIGEQVLLSDLSCEFSAQKITVILGQNGAGKSTLINCLSKQVNPTHGIIEFNGESLKNLSYMYLASKRAVLSQKNQLAFSMSVNEFIGLGLQARADINNAGFAELQKQLLHHFDLQALQQRDVLTLSGGEAQRAQLARVIAQIWPSAQNPLASFAGKWLLLDEWTAGLDLHHQQILVELLQNLVKQGLSIVMVVHDLNLAAQVADEVVLLKNGYLIAQGQPSETLTPDLIEDVLQLKISLYPRDENKYPLFLK